MRKYLGIALVLLAFQLGLQIHLADADSQTTDEAVHISAGYTYWKNFDFRFNPEHPPLVKELAALPLLFLKLNVPDNAKYYDKASSFFYDSWKENRQFGEELLYGIGNDAAKILFASRIPMILITIILGVAVFIISTRFWGGKGGIISLALFVFDPLVNGHGHFVTTDVAVSLGFLLSVYCFWLFLNKPVWKNIVLLGLAIGLALLAKFTAIIIFPLFLILLVVFLIQNKTKLKEAGKILGKIVIVLAIAFSVICSGYFFKLKQAPNRREAIFQINQLVVANKDYVFSGFFKNGQLDNTYDKLRYVSAPREYFKGLAMVIWHTERGHNSFLLGETSGVGWWYYFPVLLALKTPIPTLILFLLGIIFALKDKMQFKRNLFFLSAGLLFLLFAMTSKANLGLRHLMPITPVLFVMSGILASIKIKYIKYITGAAIVWLAAIYLFSYPFYISYYNELAGGTKNGYKVALDSNLDWGQDLLRVRNYLMERGINDAFIDYAWDGELALDYYNIPRSATTVLDDSFRGYAVISATSLQLNTYEWLRDNYNPVDRVTPSVFVFKI